MKSKRKLLKVFFLTVFLISTGLCIKQLYDNQTGNSSYQDARQLASSGNAAVSQESAQPTAAPEETVPAEMVYVPAPVSDDPYMKEMEELNLDALRQKNPDVVGWVRIPDTKIDYPIVQGEDNEYYLDYTWDGQRSSSGAIFLECTNQADMTEFHTILYGHNMANQSMFASIRNYTTMEYWQAHPYVYIATWDGVFRYEIYSSYKADVESRTYQLAMTQPRTKLAFIGYTTLSSVIDTGITPAVTDRILTLSTCSGMGHETRWVIHARLPMVAAQA